MKSVGPQNSILNPTMRMKMIFKAILKNKAGPQKKKVIKKQTLKYRTQIKTQMLTLISQ